MPPHLHPRSRLTSSLFATTLFASFFVVALPHALPCPAPRVAYADGEASPDGRRRRRRRVVVGDGDYQESSSADQDGCSRKVVSVAAARKEGNRGIRAAEVEDAAETDSGDLRIVKGKRECPVPKPGGLVGEILGFGKTRSPESRNLDVERSTGGKGERPP